MDKQCFGKHFYEVAGYVPGARVWVCKCGSFKLIPITKN